MIGKEPLDDIVEFEINGIKCVYDGVFVWAINKIGKEESKGCFEDIKLIEKTSHCAVFYSDCLGEYLSFDGEAFGGVNAIRFEVASSTHKNGLVQTPEIREQVRVFIDDDFQWEIEAAGFLAQIHDCHKGKLLIGICGNTAEGDYDIAVGVDFSENYVSWRIYRERNQGAGTIFVFNKVDYKKSLDEARAMIKNHPFSEKKPCK